LSASDEFVRKLVDSGVISPEEAQDALAGSTAGRNPDESIATFLTDRGKLTGFQAASIRQGKTKELVIGNYVILDRLGAGGMGTVYKARHRRMKRIVAIKVLSPAISENPSFVQRFQREVEVVARLNHPNVMLAYDADECEIGHFLVMEFIDGRDLGEIVKTDGAMTMRDAVDCTLQSARALDYAHSQGIVHRDIKPANLMRDKNGVVKVMDLGLARVAGSLSIPGEDSGLTREGSIAGTVDFMSPEQAVNTKTADQRADVYSLGCSLFYLLTGRHVYAGDTLMEKLLAHRKTPVPVISAIRKDVPAEIDAIFARMVAKKPQDRYQTMSEVVAALETCPVVPDRPVEFVAGHAPAVERLDATTDESGGTITIADLAVLVVEPSRMQSNIISGLLRRLGVQDVRLVKSGGEAIDMMRSSRPKLVVGAMQLPDMTGLELLDRLRSDPLTNAVSFILVSSEGDFSLIDAIRNTSRVAVLPKPFDSALLSWAMTVAVEGLVTQSMMLPKMNVTSARVLLVDDSLVARSHVRRTLQDMGIRQITEATNGREASVLLDANPFDLVVTDYNMPEMDGAALLRYIRWQSNKRSIPVIMVTTEADAARHMGVRHLGVFSLSDKNLDPQVVRAALMSSFAV
jgi:serine/threonine protein kinase